VRFALLEEVDNVQTACLGAGLGQRSQRKVVDLGRILGIVRDEHLHKQHSHKILLVVRGVNGDARVAGRQYVLHHLLVQYRVG
jgi:hypothetical protein